MKKDFSKKVKLKKVKLDGFWEAHASYSLDELIGAEIVDIGFHPLEKEGGLTICFKKDGIIKTIVFGYTELGTWIDYLGELHE